MWIRLIGLAALMATTTGCKTFSAPAKDVTIRDGEAYWMHYVSDRRGALAIRDASGQWRYCAEPFPDTATASSIVAGANRGEAINVKFDGKEDAVILPGRSSNVLTIREALYRLCEISINRPSISDEMIMAAYSEALQSIEIVAAREAETAAANAASNVAEPAPTRTSLALAQSNAGYQKLLLGEYAAAITHFAEAERIYPALHNNFGVWRELRAALADGTVSDDERLALLAKIQPGGTLNWRVPSQYAESARQEVNKAREGGK
jgi:hypothetical protein